LERPRALELSAHAEGCGECRTLLRALEGESKLLTSALRETGRIRAGALTFPCVPPENSVGPGSYRSEWRAAGLYWLWNTIIDPWAARN